MVTARNIPHAQEAVKGNRWSLRIFGQR